ncbi:RNA polymerase sigma factor [Altericroceibacterium spongiae]|uniref:RNA polymerase sigma factor n=2 Tax=Altericroceibacterium spongiae TaxID=2320269 RepID=A0A420ERZ1_9SPHN|nr:RNA polymerase sigma factor [Altericroceibacterium spongiae]
MECMVSRLIASFQEHYEQLLRFLTRRTGDVDRAADVAQETYFKLAAIEVEDQPIENRQAYIYRVAGNLAIDMMRREGRETKWIAGGEPDETVTDPSPSPERIAISRDRLRCFDEALNTLPPKARLALLMFRVDGLSHAEIAERLNVSKSMVAKYLAQALRHCRDRLWELDQK